MLRAPSFWIALVLIGALAYDGVVRDFEITLFLARKGVALIEWLAFWR